VEHRGITLMDQRMHLPLSSVSRSEVAVLGRLEVHNYLCDISMY